MRHSSQIIIAIAALVQACIPLERDLSRAQVIGWDKRAKNTAGESRIEKDKENTEKIWTALVEYPEGYDWRLNAEWRSVESKIRLFCNGKERLSFSAGPNGTGDPENNVIMDGHIYCFKADDKETIVSKDSVVLLRYPSREFIRGFIIKGGAIWTLGTHRGRGGFTLRKEGKEVLSRSEGNIDGALGEAKSGCSGALYMDTGHICFSYCVEKGGKKKWYIVKDGAEEEVRGDGEIREVCIDKGKLCRIETRGVIYSECIVMGEEQWIPPREKQEGNAFDSSFVRGADSIAVTTKNLNRSNSRIFHSLWYMGKKMCSFEGVESIIFDGRTCIGISNDATGNLKIKSSGKETDFGRCYLASERCVVLDPKSEGVYVAATSEGGGAFVALNGKILYSFQVNGYISSIEVR